ncbi:MAG: nucleotide exchange factor GrpE [Desulfobacterales bacterium]|nr:nucleotide exchange factor GrpE [Desulfobacterales bacterium]
MEDFFEIPKWLIDFSDKVDKKIVIPLIKKSINALSKWLNKKVDDYVVVSKWKETALDDFKVWLSELSYIPSSDEEDDETSEMVSCDLYTLLSEFAALRQEIKMQNREQNKTIQMFSTFLESYNHTVETFKEQNSNIQELEERIRKNCEEKMVIPFLDVRDSLVRGHESCKSLKNTKFLIFGSSHKIDTIIQGYEIALRKFDRSLEDVGVKIIKSIGNSFDPKIMKAVGTKSISGMEKGIVVEEYLTGFMRGEKILRLAEVIVNE